MTIDPLGCIDYARFIEIFNCFIEIFTIQEFEKLSTDDRDICRHDCSKSIVYYSYNKIKTYIKHLFAARTTFFTILWNCETAHTESVEP